MTFAIILSLFISGNTAGIIDNNKLYEVMLDESAGSNLMFSDRRSNSNTSIKSILIRRLLKKNQFYIMIVMISHILIMKLMSLIFLIWSWHQTFRGLQIIY